MAGMTDLPFDQDDVLTVAEAAALARRSVRTIRRAYRTGKLAAFRDGNGRGVRIRYEDLRDWLMARSAAKPRSTNSVDRVRGQIHHRKRSDGPSGESENLMLLRAVRQRRS